MTIRVSDLNRALALGALSAALLVAGSPQIRSAFARRDAWLFYTLATGVLALCAYGPIVRVGNPFP